MSELEGLWPRMRRPTLRVRLALWMAGLLSVSLILLVVFINLDVAPGSPIARVQGAWFGYHGTSSPFHSGGSQVQAVDLLRHLRTSSLVGLTLVFLVGTAGAYWMAASALRPVRAVSRAASGITAERLETRLPAHGPNDELGEMRNAFNCMLDRLQAGFQRERRFAADASHELRTPLAVMRANLEVTLADETSTLEEYRVMALRVEEYLSHLERVAADLLMLASEEKGDQRWSNRVDLGSVIDDVVRDLRPLAHRYGVVITCVDMSGVDVCGEKPHLRRAFRNLVENGIVYNQVDGRVTISCCQKGGMVVVSVTDTGVGMSLEEQRHVFERFWRADDARSRIQGGSGLGLSLAAEVVEHCGGSIEVESGVGRGTSLIVRLPMWHT